MEKLGKGGYYFLSRPRRFGKSLFLDTLKQAFLGKKELFKGLYLYSKWDWSKTYPVIHIDFGAGVIKDDKDLEETIKIKLNKIQELLNISSRFTHDIKSWFEEIIIEAYKNYHQKVVVLIDEYDKPILDVIDNKEKALAVRETLKNLYSVLKPLDQYLHLVFLTGVSKFSKVSIFSGLNQLRDITISEEFGEICGYTEKERVNRKSDKRIHEDKKKV